MLFCIVKGALLHDKRCPFTLQKTPFCNVKGHLYNTVYNYMII